MNHVLFDVVCSMCASEKFSFRYIGHKESMIVNRGSYPDVAKQRHSLLLFLSRFFKNISFAHSCIFNLIEQLSKVLDYFAERVQTQSVVCFCHSINFQSHLVTIIYSYSNYTSKAIPSVYPIVVTPLPPTLPGKKTVTFWKSMISPTPPTTTFRVPRFFDFTKHTQNSLLAGRRTSVRLASV